MTASVIIKPERERPVVQQHPWVFSGAIQEVKGNPNPGDIVDVRSNTGKFLARGYYNPKSQIVVRILTWHEEDIHDDWWRRMLQRAIDARPFYNGRQRQQPHPNGYRLINAENDYLPGLIVDRYGDFLILQALTLYIDQHKMMLSHLLTDLLAAQQIPVKGVYERSDVDVRHKEGLRPQKGLLWGEEPPPHIQMSDEKSVRLVDVRNGHKTGYYLDQIHNHDLLAGFMDANNLSDPNKRMLNLFSYTGGFGIGTGAHVTNVDSSRETLELAEQIYQLNEFAEDDVEFIQADVFEYLRDMRDNGELFDVVILDPPKFASSMGQIERAARGYKDINLNAFHIVKPGGCLMTFSCSGAVNADLFQKIVFGALADSGRQAQILRHLGPGDDHPVALTFPEGAYLKGLLLRVY